MKISNEDKVSLKIIGVGVTLLVLFLLVCFGVYHVIEEKSNFYKQPKQCFSKETIDGCEQAAFVVEKQLQSCEWAFKLCVQTNEDLLQRLQNKGEK